uniref:Uncharacterized protein n=1 Tax=Onchocerca volvulus TaxID=6282 RepID=A0A8R1TVG2_ONCVO
MTNYLMQIVSNLYDFSECVVSKCADCKNWLLIVTKFGTVTNRSILEIWKYPQLHKTSNKLMNILCEFELTITSMHFKWRIDLRVISCIPEIGLL